MKDDDINDFLNGSINELDDKTDLNTLGVQSKIKDAEWEFRCSMCGNHIDSDINYCYECNEHAGQWELIDENDEVLEVREV